MKLVASSRDQDPEIPSHVVLSVQHQYHTRSTKQKPRTKSGYLSVAVEPMVSTILPSVSSLSATPTLMVVVVQYVPLLQTIEGSSGPSNLVQGGSFTEIS